MKERIVITEDGEKGPYSVVVNGRFAGEYGEGELPELLGDILDRRWSKIEERIREGVGGR